MLNADRGISEKTHIWATEDSATTIAFKSGDTGKAFDKAIDEKDEIIRKLKEKLQEEPASYSSFDTALARLLPLKDGVDLKAIEDGLWIDNGEDKEMLQVKEDFEKNIRLKNFFSFSWCSQNRLRFFPFSGGTRASPPT